MPFLDDLKAFNHALVYGFDPEDPCNPIPSQDPRYPIHVASQYEDVYHAYLYAQNVILPAMNSNGIKEITAQQVLQWINEIHARIGARLAQDFQENGYDDVAAGRYVKPGSEILRWHAGEKIENMIIFCLSFEPTLSEREKSNLRMADKVSESFNVDRQELAAFLALVQKKYPTNLPEPPKKVDLSIGKRRLLSLINDWMDGKLKDEEIIIARKIITVGMRAEKLLPSMQAYAERTLKALIACDRKDVDQVSSFLAKAFYELTDIHPYFNANGRTATCWVNTLLVAMGYRSILIRTPRERDDVNSRYSLAIKELNDGKCERLAAHFKARIVETMAGNEYSDEGLKKVITIRVEVKNLLQQIAKEFPTFDLNTYFAGPINTSLLERVRSCRNSAANMTDNEISLQGMSASKKLLTDKLTELRAAQMKQEMKNAIATLSEKADWKSTEKDGLKIWHAFPIQEAKAVKEALSVYPCFTVEYKPVTGDQHNAVVFVSNINMVALADCSKKKSEEATQSKANSTIKSIN